MERCAWKLTSWLELIPEQSALAVCYHYLVTTLSVTHWSIITIWAYVCVRVFVRACVCFHLCIINDKTNITLFLSLPPLPLPSPVLFSQMAVLTCVTVTASAPWASRVGIVNVRRGGGALVAVLPWRPPVPTTRTTKEVSLGGGAYSALRIQRNKGWWRK